METPLEAPIETPSQPNRMKLLRNSSQIKQIIISQKASIRNHQKIMLMTPCCECDDAKID